MAKILGIDYGDVRIGTAVSDITETIAGPLQVVYNKKGCLEKIHAICDSMSIEKIVVGYPKNMDGSEGGNCKKVDAFCEEIAPFVNGNIVKWDERLSSVAIHAMLAETGGRVGKEKGKVDIMAAVYILQGYLEYCRNKNKREI